MVLNDILTGACEILEICPTNNTGDYSASSSSSSLSVQLTRHVQLVENNQQSSEPLTFVQISDIHMDKDYTEVGMPLDCVRWLIN